LLLKIYECISLPAKGATLTLHSLTLGIYDASTKGLLLLLLGHPFSRATSKQRPLIVTLLIETGSAMVNRRDRVLQIPGATGKSNYKIVMQEDETR
jgi:hypothetical protein